MAARKKSRESERKTEPLRQAAFTPSSPVPAPALPSNPIALLDADEAISTPVTTHGVAQAAARQIVLFTNADVCTISLWDEGGNLVTLWAEYSRGALTTSPVSQLPYPASDYPTTSRVLQTGEPVLLRISDPTLQPDERILMKGMNASALLMLPLMSQKKTIGLIEVFETSPQDTISSVEIASIQVIAKHAGISLERADLLEKAEQHAAELEIIRKASLNLTASLDQQQVFNAILKSALRLSPDALDAHIFTLQEGELKFGASMWADGQNRTAYKNVRKGGLTDQVATSGEIIAIERVDTHPLYEDSEWIKSGWRGSIVGLPLKTGKEVVGVMNIAYLTRQDFSEERLRLLGLLGDQAAIAIYNARLHDLVKLQAVTDPLTGVANRRAFNDRLDEELRRSNRYNHPFSLMILDMDRFKEVNDSFGHLVGDRTLQEVAACLLRSVRDTDFVARYGGDEFALILPETDREQAVILAGKINEKLFVNQMPWPENSHIDGLTASIGVANFPTDGQTAETLISIADNELYLKKAATNQPPSGSE
jgi:diguanylate cyclase (GGDEF)-like protein